MEGLILEKLMGNTQIFFFYISFQRYKETLL